MDQSTTARLEEAEEAGSAAALRLVAMVDGREAGRLLLSAEPVVVGRSPGTDLVLAHPTVSSRHLEVRFVSGRAHVRDLESTNGTWFQGSRVREVVLPPGATLKLGMAELRVEDATLPDPITWGPFIAVSPRMRQALEVLQQAAATDLPVLLEGESGTGKSTAARALHASSRRAAGPFLTVDCRALTPERGGAELFGQAEPGALERASGGTLLLAEAGHLPASLQPALLKALSERRLQRVGERNERAVELRVLASTSTPLEAEVVAGRFSRELLQRLAVIHVHLPALRERLEDLLALVRALLEEMGPRASGFTPSPDLLRALAEHPWSGNVRELRTLLEGAVERSTEGEPRPPGPAPMGAAQISNYHAARARVLEEFERQFVAQLLKVHGNNISRAARDAGLNRAYLHRLIKRLGLSV